MMKASIDQITLREIDGHWRSEEGRYHMWLLKEEGRVQVFEEQKAIIDEPLEFEYKEEDNVVAISKSVILWMVLPREGSIVIRFCNKTVELSQ